jgi:hypothetical protein
MNKTGKPTKKTIRIDESALENNASEDDNPNENHTVVLDINKESGSIGPKDAS